MAPDLVPFAFVLRVFLSPFTSHLSPLTDTPPPMAFLTVEHISKNFPGVRALDDVSVDFEQGSVHALMGENGAGKSTLGKIIAGVYTADEGTIKIEGHEVR